MKKFWLLSTLALFSFNSFAQQSSFTCQDIYIKTMNRKEVVKARVDRINDGSPGILLVVSAVNPVAGLVYLGTAIGAEVYATSPSKEERVLRLADQSDKQIKRLVNKLQKKVSGEITEEEVRKVIQKGIDNGTFCQDFPRLYKVRDVKKYVETSLRIKYAN